MPTLPVCTRAPAFFVTTATEVLGEKELFVPEGDEVNVVKVDPVFVCVVFAFVVGVVWDDCVGLLLAVVPVVVAPADTGVVVVALDPPTDPEFTMLETISASSAVRLLKKLRASGGS